MTLVERWNGTAWLIQSSANPTRGGVLSGVSCVAATCTAVGNSNQNAPLADRWSGSGWVIQPAASPSVFASLSGVSCTAASACFARTQWNDAEQDDVGRAVERDCLGNPAHAQSDPDGHRVCLKSAVGCVLHGGDRMHRGGVLETVAVHLRQALRLPEVPLHTLERHRGRTVGWRDLGDPEHHQPRISKVALSMKPGW